MLQGEILQSVQMDGNWFKPEQNERFANDQEYYKSFIRAIEEQVNARFRTVLLSLSLSHLTDFRQ
jgi:hypothetical protein